MMPHNLLFFSFATSFAVSVAESALNVVCVCVFL